MQVKINRKINFVFLNKSSTGEGSMKEKSPMSNIISFLEEREGEGKGHSNNT